jgi:hypothetical protein
MFHLYRDPDSTERHDDGRPIPPITLARISLQQCECGCGGEKKWHAHKIQYAVPKLDEVK